MKRRLAGLILLCFCLLGLPNVVLAETAAPQKVMIITVDNAVEPGLASYLERNIAIAKENQAGFIDFGAGYPRRSGGRSTGNQKAFV